MTPFVFSGVRCRVSGFGCRVSGFGSYNWKYLNRWCDTPVPDTLLPDTRHPLLRILLNKTPVSRKNRLSAGRTIAPKQLAKLQVKLVHFCVTVPVFRIRTGRAFRVQHHMSSCDLPDALPGATFRLPHPISLKRCAQCCTLISHRAGDIGVKHIGYDLAPDPAFCAPSGQPDHLGDD